MPLRQSALVGAIHAAPEPTRHRRDRGVRRCLRAAAPVVALLAASACASGAGRPHAAAVQERLQGAHAERPTPNPGRAPGSTALRAGPGGVFYEVFVRSFRDSDGDGIGDLRGLIDSLDALNDGDPRTDHDLGVDGLWLMPIHPSPSYHGYDVTDYRAVHPDYGTLADLDVLIAECHRRGMRVILDFVLNHTSSEHPWFQAALAGDSRHREFYHWRADPDPRWRRPWDGESVWHASPAASAPCASPADCERAAGAPYYFALFWSGMPDLALTRDPVLAEMLDAMRFWLARGIDGFRLDAVRHLVEDETIDPVMLSDSEGNHALLRQVRRSLERDFPDALLVGEAWSPSTEIARYRGAGDELHLAFSFAVASGIRQAIREGQRVYLRETVDEVAAAFGDHPDFQAPFLGNHDVPRLGRALGGDVDALALAHALLLAWPGTPFLYYGDEVGMQGGASNDDPDKRTPMRWREGEGSGFTSARRPWHDAPEQPGVSVGAQTGAEDSLHTALRRLVRLRAGSSALRQGALGMGKVSAGGRGAFVLTREDEDSGERVWLVGNLHPEATAVSLVWPGDTAGEAPAPLLARGLREPPAWQGQAGQSEGVALRVALAGRGFAFFAVPPGANASPRTPSESAGADRIHRDE